MGRLDFLMDNLGLEKQSTRQPLSFTGIINNYYTVVEIDEGQYSSNSFLVQIGIVPTVETKDEINLLVNDVIDEHKAHKVEDTSDYLIALVGNMPMRKKNVQAKIEAIILTIIERLDAMNIPSGDFLNGHQDESVSLYQVGNGYSYLSSESYQELSTTIEAEKNASESEFKSISSGIGGAIVGALIGAVVWGVLLYFGFYAWFAAILGITLAINFYVKNNGLLSLKGIIIVTGIVLITLLLANVIAYSFVLYQGLAQFGFTFTLILINFIPLLQELELLSTFMFDLVLGVGISALFAGVYAYRLYNNTKNVNKIEKM